MSRVASNAMNLAEADPMNRTEWDAIVIGSGLGGLTAAAYLTTNGQKTLVLEQDDVAGGSSQVFRRKRQWEFDVGVHYLGDCGPDGLIPSVLRGVGCGDKVEFLEMDPDGFDTLKFPDLEFRVPKGWDSYLERLIAAFPDEEAGLRKCVKVLRNLAKELGMGPPRSLLGALSYPLRAHTVIRWNMKTLGDLFDSCDLSDRARAVIAAESGTYGAPPSRATVLMHAALIDHYLKDGAYYPKGGGQVIAAHLVDAIRSHGGHVRTLARVERILVEDGRATGVRLCDGEEFKAPIVVSDADIKKTFLDLVGEEHLKAKTVKRIHRYKMALPLFCVYLGLDIDLRDRMPNTNFLLYSGYDIEAAYGDCYEGRVPEKVPFYITSASVKDPYTEAIAPKGCSSLEIMTMAPSDYSFWHVGEGPAAGEKYSRNPDYLAVKDMLTEKLIDGAEQVIPDIRDHILWKEAATPITHERYTLASAGTSYGLEHSPDQWGLKRPKPRTEIEGLFLAGASTVYAHGVAGVMAGGVGTASSILRRNLLKETMEGRVFGDPSKLASNDPDWDPWKACRRLSKKKRPARKREPAVV